MYTSFLANWILFQQQKIYSTRAVTTLSEYTHDNDGAQYYTVQAVKQWAQAYPTYCIGPYVTNDIERDEHISIEGNKKHTHWHARTGTHTHRHTGRERGMSARLIANSTQQSQSHSIAGERDTEERRKNGRTRKKSRQ